LDCYQLKEQSAMLLSNLLTNDEVRKHIRYLSWCDPMTAILQSGNQSAVCQVTRCIVNITFDEHCRYMCVKAGLAAKLKNAASRVRGDDVNELTKTACSNMDVGVSANVSKEVDEKLRTGQITKITAPTSNLKEQKKNDFEGLDDLLGSSGSTSYKPSQPKPTAKPTSSALDDLDSLLDGPSSKPKTTTAAITQNVQKPVSQPAKKPQTSFDDLDDLLSSTPSKPQAKPQPKNDIDDLFSGMTQNKQPAKTQQRTAVIDDLDDLLGDFGKPPQKQPQKQPQKHTDMDDIDSLLADMQPPSKGGGHHKAQDDDIDSLLADLGSKKNANKGKSSNEIDDLLADLL